MSGSFVPILVAIMVFPTVLLITAWILDRVNPPKHFASTTNRDLAMVIAALAAITAAWKLWI
jgi:hypothetical protein